MGLRIRTNVSALTAQRFSENNSKDMNQSLERLSSGYRINKSKDDAAGLAISEGMRAKVRGLNQAKRNANDAISLVQVAEGSMNEISNILVRMRELTIQSSSDTVGDTERSYLNREYTQLVGEIDRISATTEFSSFKLFDEDQKDELVIQVGVNGSSPDENLDTITLNLEGLKGINSEGFNLGVDDEIGPMDADGSIDRESIVENLNNIDNALNTVAGERATLGSVQSRLGSAVNNISIQNENLRTANSRIRDVDFAEESSKLTQSRMLQQASVSVLAQANQLPDIALQLLR